jgi:pimeloyl-ACP methyl ester carboxylesterase
MAADVAGLIDAAGREHAVLVGHDWGAGVAWWVAAEYPERLAKLIILNLPHITVFLESLKHSFRQNLKSWYRLFFQIPWLPEVLLELWNWKMMVYSMTSSSHTGTFSEKEMAVYKEAWSQPRAIQSMLNAYRAVVQRPPGPLKEPRIRMPTLLIWGARDTFFLEELVQESIDMCDDGRLEMIEGATHWVHHEAVERVNELLVSFLQENGSR